MKKTAKTAKIYGITYEICPKKRQRIAKKRQMIKRLSIILDDAWDFRFILTGNTHECDLRKCLISIGMSNHLTPMEIRFILNKFNLGLKKGA